MACSEHSEQRSKLAHLGIVAAMRLLYAGPICFATAQRSRLTRFRNVCTWFLAWRTGVFGVTIFAHGGCDTTRIVCAPSLPASPPREYIRGDCYELSVLGPHELTSHCVPLYHANSSVICLKSKRVGIQQMTTT